MRPAAARFDGKLGEFILPYAAVRAAGDPDGTLLDFLQTTYEAAAELGVWDRLLLERDHGSSASRRQAIDGEAASRLLLARSRLARPVDLTS